MGAFFSAAGSTCAENVQSTESPTMSFDKAGLVELEKELILANLRNGLLSVVDMTFEFKSPGLHCDAQPHPPFSTIPTGENSGFGAPIENIVPECFVEVHGSNVQQNYFG